jgi:AAHS family benzoate transporter-like MFS transporter
MGRAGFSTNGSLAFLLVLNGGAVLGALAASRFADRFGPKRVVAASFLLGAAAIALLTAGLPLGVLLAFIAVVGLGTSGTQILIYGFVATYYRTNVRSAGVAWCAGFGRLGGIGGPLIGGLLIASGLALNTIFYVLTALAVGGSLLTLLVPTAESRAASSPRGAAVPIRTPAPGERLVPAAD